jgi:Icc-related predicted phosphoesterase
MKCVVISDTHSREKKIEWFKLKENIDSVDMIIHAGDFSHNEKTFNDFLKWYSELDIKYKILIAGNHDEIVRNMGYNEMRQICYTLDIIYLQDSGIELEGVKIWGSPWSNIFGDWAFMMNDFELDQHWQKIPEDTEILITHGPAYGRCDEISQDTIDNHVGSRTLEMRLRDLKKLRYHFVGHIHDSNGEIFRSYDGKMTTYNACIMDFWFMPTGEPHIFEI